MPYKDPDTQRAAQHAEYLRHKDRYRARRTRKRAMLRAVVEMRLRISVCCDCGESDYRVLEYDHVRGRKVDSISNIVRSKANLSILLNEIKKCDVRCANCHRRRHHPLTNFRGKNPHRQKE